MRLKPIPQAIRDYCLEHCCQDRSAAYLSADLEGRLLRWGGSLDRYRLPNLKRGDLLEEKAVFLKGFLPLKRSPIILPQLEIAHEVYMEVHLFQGAGKQWVLMLDASHYAGQRRRQQQMLNQQQLRTESAQTDLQLVLGLLRKLDFAIFLRRGDDVFEALDELPEWLTALLPPDTDPQAFQPGQAFLFLDNFLVDARRFWRLQGAGMLKAGLWNESQEPGPGQWLDAFAVCLPGRDVLVLAQRESHHQEKRELLQKARQEVLAHQALIREIHHRDVLLHCLMHDLGSPISAIHVSLSLLQNKNLSENDRRWLKACETSAEHIQALVEQVKEVCFPRAGKEARFRQQPTVDLANVIRETTELLAPSAVAADVTIERDPNGPWKETCLARGEHLTLERVLFNLLENALRFSPPKGRIKVQLHPANSWWQVNVEDQGPGVDPDFEKNLFVRFAQGPSRPGRAGLGLYFSRLVIESWGGRIDYRPAQNGGSCFYFRLPRKSNSPVRAFG